MVQYQVHYILFYFLQYSNELSLLSIPIVLCCYTEYIIIQATTESCN